MRKIILASITLLSALVVSAQGSKKCPPEKREILYRYSNKSRTAHMALQLQETKILATHVKDNKALAVSEIKDILAARKKLSEELTAMPEFKEAVAIEKSADCKPTDYKK